jgi:ribosomal protein L7/L12
MKIIVSAEEALQEMNGYELSELLAGVGARCCQLQNDVDYWKQEHKYMEEKYSAQRETIERLQAKIVELEVLTVQLTEEEKAMIREGNTETGVGPRFISAIKKLRERTSLGLREAKMVCDAYRATLNEDIKF